MKVQTAILPYFGGKRTIAPEIVLEFGKHLSYWEPFCGSCAVLFAKRPSRFEVVCDAYSLVTNLAQVLADLESARELYARARATLFCEALYEESKAWLKANPAAGGLEAAYHFLILSWQGRCGYAGMSFSKYGRPSLYYTNTAGGGGASNWVSTGESIPWWHERLRNVVIRNGDAFDLLSRIEDEAGTVVYCDPPYYTEGAAYARNFDNSNGADQHERLAKALHRFKKARVVVSYYDCSEVRRLYDGWTRKPIHAISRTKRLRNVDTAGLKMPEVLLINGPSYTDFFLRGPKTCLPKPRL